MVSHAGLMSQQPENRGQREIVKVFRSVDFKDYIYPEVFIAREKYTSDLNIPANKNIQTTN